MISTIKLKDDPNFDGEIKEWEGWNKKNKSGKNLGGANIY